VVIKLNDAMGNEAYHIPVLLQEAINGLKIDPDGVYVDVTFGGGGHSAEILKCLDQGRLLAFDQDPDALKNVPEHSGLTFIPQNFRYMRNYLKMHRAVPADGILADLGVSSHQFDEGERGFSIRTDAPLDMRMNPSVGKSVTELLQQAEEEKLAEIFKVWGEIRPAKALARSIVESREYEAIETTGQLKAIAEKFAPRFKEHKFFAQVFQALRIEVNEEMSVLKDFLEQSVEVLKPGGRLVVISYHSLEDRLVKNFMRSGKFSGEVEQDFFGNQIRPFKPLPGQPIVPNEEEIKRNPRSRSAKMRIAERLA